MHESLKINKAELDKAEDTWDYLFAILQKYYQLWDAEPDKVVENFNNEQHSLLAYATLDGQVRNGGFIQLIYNGYGDYVFESPFIETMKVWGALDTAELLEEVAELHRQALIGQQDDDTLQEFSNLYEDYPQFEEYDDSYYDIDESNIVMNYIKLNLDKFIILE